MTGWWPTAALVRGAAVTAVLTLAALALGRPDLLVLAAPFALLGALGVAHAPRGRVVAQVHLADRWLHEGQSTRWQVRVVEGVEALEQVTVTLASPAYVALEPASGTLSTGAPTERGLALSVSPRRWGVRSVGSALVAAGSRWGGFRWGPVPLPERMMTVIPETSSFSSAENPHPVGLIGQNRSRRAGHGSEFWGIRPFQPGDRLRRVDWRTTLRTREVHAVGTDAQEDSSVLVLLDATADVGASDGVDGRASSLDVAVRAASALAGHHLRVGDRVALRVIGGSHLVVGPGSGLRHHRRIQERLTQVRPGWPDLLQTRLRFRAGAGTIVVVLTPLLTQEITTAMVELNARGLTVVAVDTLPPDSLPETARQPGSAGRVAWRMRLLEREMLVTEITRRGIPVVAWRGPGTLDEVLRRLARRGRLPREVTR